MFGLSMEHLLIVGVVLLVFGPRNLPALGGSLGKSLRNFKIALNGLGEAEEPPRALPAEPEPRAITAREAGAGTSASS
jgi:sec-independent protein translocase protein TatA